MASRKNKFSSGIIFRTFFQKYESTKLNTVRKFVTLQYVVKSKSERYHGY